MSPKSPNRLVAHGRRGHHPLHVVALGGHAGRGALGNDLRVRAQVGEDPHQALRRDLEWEGAGGGC